jgi:hypothetical protein
MPIIKFEVNPDLHAQIVTAAADDYRSVASFVRMRIREWLHEYYLPPPPGFEDTSGTSLIGHLGATYDELVAEFGEPDYVSEWQGTYAEWERGEHTEEMAEITDGKVRVYWVIKTGEGIATVYDWMENVPVADVTHWHIGGRVSNATDVIDALKFNYPFDDIISEEEAYKLRKLDPERPARIKAERDRLIELRKSLPPVPDTWPPIGSRPKEQPLRRRDTPKPSKLKPIAERSRKDQEK